MSIVLFVNFLVIRDKLKPENCDRVMNETIVLKIHPVY